ncbi:Hint domain-containing protein [Paracoccus aminophilus]|uniref:Hedgehog/Intein (Hint) domain-containing protein n=1 Tax=Paracoccus aminophilus JCM 7686 TaxID=1367847 RepID=S5YHU1_PARAH|nr:Hint domain-containing protein [Paracoccus aminophilus]AGT11028.1 hypothetical protein JCM7686_pAMI4p342 [Paracoccus aminophilus JCM 7686]
MGNFSRWDTTPTTASGNYIAENAQTWVNSVSGKTFTDNDGLEVRPITYHNYDNNDYFATNDYPNAGVIAQDYITDPKNSTTGHIVRIDSVIVVRITVTYKDALGNIGTKTGNIHMIQMDNGDAYLYPSKEVNGGVVGSRTLLDDLNIIQGIRVDSLISNNGTGDGLIYHDSTIVGTTQIACFAAGTMIESVWGPVAVETLAVGDLVMTRDEGLQELRWVGLNKVSAEELAASPELRPIRIKAGALGTNVPAEDLVVSPQHRILVRSAIAKRTFGAEEILVAAKQLLQIPGIDIAEDLDGVTYVHFLFDKHQIVLSNGAETESLFTGPEALKSVGPAARDEILALFPELAAMSDGPVPVRPLAPGRLARKLAVRHVVKQRPLLADA